MDRHGTSLNPGDSVLYEHDEDTVLSATVLREVEPGCYLIQLDQRGPRPPAPTPDLQALQLALRDQLDAAIAEVNAALAEMGEPPIEVQEPFLVTGDHLEYLGEWDDDTDNDEEP